MSSLNANTSLAIAEKYIKFCTWTYDMESRVFLYSPNLFKIIELTETEKG